MVVGQYLYLSKPIAIPPHTVTLFTDALSFGWGAQLNDNHANGLWTEEEGWLHINALELKAVYFGLRSLLQVEHCHVRVMIDNTTAVAYVNNMGGTKSGQCNKEVRSIWDWCESKSIWLSAAHIPGKLNVQADFHSCNFTQNKEWALSDNIFNRLCGIWG